MLGILQWLKICRLKWHRYTPSENNLTLCLNFIVVSGEFYMLSGLLTKYNNLKTSAYKIEVVRRFTKFTAVNSIWYKYPIQL